MMNGKQRRATIHSGSQSRDLTSSTSTSASASAHNTPASGSDSCSSSPDKAAPHIPTHAPASTTLPRTNSEASMSDKYGSLSRKELGRGATAVVRLCSPVNSDKKYAIKEFKARRKGEQQKQYIKKLTSEFCISSSLLHENVVRTVDLIQDDKKRWCLVMEYSEGGDLFSKIQAGLLTDTDLIDCYFKQLANGVAYLHSEGVAHRDLKPENLLLDASCRILKITDFGISAVFHLPLETGTKTSTGECGSGPYMAPEVFLGIEYAPDLVDIWSIGIIYYVMALNSIPWVSAKPADTRFMYYKDHFGKFVPIDRLLPHKRKVMYRLLQPEVSKRITMKELLTTEWLEGISCCHVGMPVEAVAHSHKALLPANLAFSQH
ncbi:kinase-like domain-containing protein [Obelidium mucronatum]|nr:kinase-like domain-containing protein [Obelidium mucronatum]